MRLAAVLLTALAGFCAGARAQQGSIDPPQMQVGTILNASLIDGLVAVRQERLAVVFSFVSDDRTALAFANLLMTDHGSLKSFVAAKEKQLKKYSGISRWDKQVFLLLVGMNSQPQLPQGLSHLSKKLTLRVSELALAQGYELEEMRQKQVGEK